MKIKKVVALVGVGIALVTGISRWYRIDRKTAKGVQPARQEPGKEVWAEVLAEDARVFNGLYTGLYRAAGGQSGKPEKVLIQWCRRACHRWENQPVDILCREMILPLAESGDREALISWAGAVLAAGEKTGITMERAETLVLTEEHLEDYLEWNGGDLEPGDTVRIITPAWYQNGTLLEQGQCEKTVC